MGKPATIYLTDELEKQARARAKRFRSFSDYVATLIKRDLGHESWPQGFFETVAGGWQGEPPVIARGKSQKRDSF